MTLNSHSSLEKGFPIIIPAGEGQSVTGKGPIIEKHRITDHVDDLSQVEASRGWFGALVRYAQIVRVEERGIERVKEEDRVKQSSFDGFTMWASANFT